MKFLLLNPPFLPLYSRFSRSPAVTKSGTIYYPIWHAYAAGVLEQAGFEVKLVDAPAAKLSREDCLRIAKNFAPDVVVTYTATPSIFNDVQVAADIKEALPNSFAVLTGPHATALPKETLELDSRLDAVARAEYDYTLVELGKSLPSRSALGSIGGLTYRDGAEIRSNCERRFAEADALDSMPFVSSVYKKHLRVEDYFYAHCRYPVVSFFTSRGCYAKCSFCQYPKLMFGNKQRQRSPENIVAEFEYVQKELPQTREVLIDDDTFSFHQEHTHAFCELMISRKIKIPWTIEGRANIEYETLALLKRAGCRMIVVGFESADNQILKNMRKGVSHERMLKFVEDAKRAKVMIHACFMAGNPGETRQTLETSLAFAKEIMADTCQFFPLMVYPGTEAYDWALKNGYLTTTDFGQWLTPEGMHNTIVSTPQLSARELVEFCDYARRAYYLSPAYLWYKLKRVAFNPEELSKTFKSARTFAKYLLFKNTLAKPVLSSGNS